MTGLALERYRCRYQFNGNKLVSFLFGFYSFVGAFSNVKCLRFFFVFQNNCTQQGNQSFYIILHDFNSVRYFESQT